MLLEDGLKRPAELLRPDGRWLLAQAERIVRPGRRLVMLTCANITDERRTSDELRMRVEENEVVVKHSGKHIQRYDARTDTACNIGGSAALLGGRRMINNFVQKAMEMKLVAPVSEESFKAFYGDIRSGKPDGNCELLLNTPNVGPRWHRFDYTLLHDADGATSQAIISFFDSTARREQELAYKKWKSAISTMIAQSVFYIEANVTKNVVERVEGGSGDDKPSADAPRSLSEFIEKDCDRYADSEDRPLLLSFFSWDRLLSMYDSMIYEDSTEFRSEISGNPIWYKVTVQLAKYPDSEDVKLFAAFSDVDKAHAEKERLSALATRDSLTRLLNRGTAERGIREALSQAGAKDTSALFMIDLDNFKQINDTLGHQAGDRALGSIADAIASVFRCGDIVGRMGGDEFIAFIAGGASFELAEAKAAAIIEASQFSLGNLIITASVGVSLGTGNSKTFEQLYAESDNALYQAKNDGKNSYRISEYAGNTHRLLPSEKSASVQLKSLLEYMDGGVVLATVGNDINITYVSPSFFKSMSRDEEEVGKHGEKLLTLVYPEDLNIVTSALHAAAETSESVDCSYRVGKDGAEWRHLRAVRLAEQTEKSSVIGVISDITELKRSESRLSISEERYRMAAELTGAMIWEVDIPAKTLYLSKEAESALGLKSAVYHNMPDDFIAAGAVHQTSIEDFGRMYDDLYAGEDGKKYTILSQYGACGYAWLRIAFRLLRDGRGNPMRSVGILERLPNIDADMRSFETELRFSDSIESSLLGIIRVNLSSDHVEKLTTPSRTRP